MSIIVGLVMIALLTAGYGIGRAHEQQIVHRDWLREQKLYEK